MEPYLSNSKSIKNGHTLTESHVAKKAGSANLFYYLCHSDVLNDSN